MHSPRIAQYREMKARHPGLTVLFRVSSDAYESFGEDAETVASLCGLVATMTESKGVAVTRFASDKLEIHLRKLLRAGLRVGVAEVEK